MEYTRVYSRLIPHGTKKSIVAFCSINKVKIKNNTYRKVVHIYHKLCSFVSVYIKVLTLYITQNYAL